MKVYAINFQYFCAQITNLELSMGDKIDCFVHGLKLKIYERVVVDLFNKGGVGLGLYATAYLRGSNGRHH